MIIGQGTIGIEIEEQIKPDIIIVPIGGGGLISGISNYFNKDCLIYGVESLNSDSMNQAINNNKPVYINNINTFIDGTRVDMVGNLTFKLLRYDKKYRK